MEPTVIIIPSLISGIISCILAYKVYFENPTRIQNRMFVWLMVGFITLMITQIFVNLVNEPHLVLLYSRFFYISAVFTPVFLLHISYVFPGNHILKYREKLILTLLYIANIMILFYFNIVVSIKNVKLSNLGNTVHPSEELSFLGFYISIVLIFAVIRLISKYFKPSSEIEKNQLKQVIYGGGFSSLVILIHITLVNLGIVTYFAMPLSTSIFSLFIAAGILRYDLLTYRPLSELFIKPEKISLLNRDELEKEVQARTDALLKSNKLLQLEIDQRKSAENRMKDSLKEKEILLKELHHRVKNNLQIISSLIYLQTRKINEEKINILLNEINSRILSMSLIHENIYKSDKYNEINFNDYVQTLVHELLSIYKNVKNNIEIKIKISDIFLDIDKSILSGLIINELVMNALKHAFPENRDGTIFIKMKNDVNGYNLSIKDDGVGIPEDFNIEKSKTLGLQLVNNLVKQLNGTISIHSNKTTEFKITIPK